MRCNANPGTKLGSGRQMRAGCGLASPGSARNCGRIAQSVQHTIIATMRGAVREYQGARCKMQSVRCKVQGAQYLMSWNSCWKLVRELQQHAVASCSTSAVEARHAAQCRGVSHQRSLRQTSHRAGCLLQNRSTITEKLLVIYIMST